MLVAEGLIKRFGDVLALEKVTARFSPGEIHAVLGENGAGKSTLMHLLAGFAQPDAGTATLDGQDLPFGRPFESRRLGIAMIHQHFTLVPAFRVEENLALAHLGRLGEILKPAVDTSGLGWRFDPKARTDTLTVGERQRLEIVKSVGPDARVVIFDEPTAVLSPDEVEDLFAVLRRLRDSGRIVVLIAHKLAEVMRIADRVTVLRRGRVVAEAPIDQVTPERLAEWMVGEVPPGLDTTAPATGETVLSGRDLEAVGDRGEPALRGIDLDVLGGEILGVGGVDGNGQVELAEVLAGVRPFKGTLRRARTVAYIPEDRQTDGLALTMSVRDNLLITGHRREDLRRGPFLLPVRIGEWVAALIERFSISAASSLVAVGTLSGGNQQKVVVARALDEDPDLLVAVNPSRGLDVKATETVHRLILGARDRGAAVVLISTDLDELAALATRTVFLSRGHIVEASGATGLLGGAH